MQLDRDWEEGLPWIMLPAREVVQESMGFSPNDLVFGHKVRGLLSIFWEFGKVPKPPKNLASYILGFKNRLIQARELVKVNLEKHQKNMKRLYDRRVKHRVFEPGDQVLVLRPMTSSPFEAKFDGPFVVQRKLTDENYDVTMPSRKKPVKLCYVNLQQHLLFWAQSELLLLRAVYAPGTFSHGANMLSRGNVREPRISPI